MTRVFVWNGRFVFCRFRNKASSVELEFRMTGLFLQIPKRVRNDTELLSP